MIEPKTTPQNVKKKSISNTVNTKGGTDGKT